MEQKPEIQISIKEVNQISYNQKQLPIDVDEIEIGKNLMMGLGFRLDMDVEKEIFKVSLQIKLSVYDYDDSIVDIETETIFGITNLKAVAHYSEDNQVKVEDNLLDTLLRVCIGTTRGILVANTKGTAMSKFPLPILNTREIIEQMKSE